MANFSVIILTAPPAGMAGEAGGPFVKVDGRESLLRAVELFLNRENIKQIQLVFTPDMLEEGKRKYGGHLSFSGVKVLAAGPKWIDQTIAAGAKITEGTTHVLIHDAARPAVAYSDIDAILDAAEKSPAVALASPVRTALAEVDEGGNAIAWHPPKQFMHLLTPQVFSKTKFDELVQAKREPHAAEVTLLKGSPLNLRVGGSGDAGLVGAMLKMLPKPKIKPPSSPFEEGAVVSEAPANSDYKIYPTWKDLVVYDEGDARKVRMDCDFVDDLYQVVLPAAEVWDQKTPDWAHGRRELILERLRAAKCIICEQGTTTSTTHSPDGTFRVEVYYEQDERGYPMRAIRVIRNSDDAKLIDLDQAQLGGALRFDSPGKLILPFYVGKLREQIGVDVVRETFWFHPMDEPIPLRDLSQLLVQRTPETPVPVATMARPRWRETGWNLFLLFGSMLLTTGGVWMSRAGHTTKDRVIGIFAMVFFGACAIAAILDLRKWFG